MMTLGPLGFLSPWLLTALLALPAIWWLLRVTPPGPNHVFFPATRLLVGLKKDEEDRAHSPWWLTLIRLLAAAAIIFALARPVLNPNSAASSSADLNVIIVDNGWAAADNWDARRATLTRLLQQAEERNRPVLLLTTADSEPSPGLAPQNARQALERASSLAPKPYAPNRPQVLKSLKAAELPSRSLHIYWLSDDLDHGKAQEFLTGLAELAGSPERITVFRGGEQAAGPLALSAVIDAKGDFIARILSPGRIAYQGGVTAYDEKGRPIAEQPFKLQSGEPAADVRFEMPLELRNQITRLEISGRSTAGATHLVDNLASWRRVGLLSGESAEEAQPLLSPLYYVRKALAPYAELTNVADPNIANAVRDILARDVATLIMTSIGRLGYETTEELGDWINRGGILVRFAGPKLEQADDELLSVPLRQGGRALGGALSWSQPQKLAVFEEGSPFFGLEAPEDISVSRQVLADPSQMSDDTLIWARLQDNTPLVTARRVGRGLLILFHVTANSSWSNLPHSGLFVDMLRRIGELSTGVVSPDERTAGASDRATGGQKAASGKKDAELPSLPPLRVMDGFGRLQKPGNEVEPVRLTDIDKFTPSPAHPPGFYGAGGKRRALNVAAPDTRLTPLAALPAGVGAGSFAQTSSRPLAPWLLTAALLLFLADGLIVTLMRGFINQSASARAASLALAAGLGLLLLPTGEAAAQSDARKNPAADRFALQMSLETRLAFVRSGNPVIDRNSRMGLDALAREVSRRTAFEPASSIGVDIKKDELAFFPLLYWPVPDDVKELDEQALARVNAYMKQGGVILFDTRNQISDVGAAGAFGVDRGPLARLLQRMDIPPLEPVPTDHVLTRSFYLLGEFPGRWAGGRLWVEAAAKAADSGKARSADGVSSIIITSNDFAAAWATDSNGRSLFPVVPGGERQREMAYRTGINIIMYALTGNYKADQVHLPALMRRLGQ